MGGIRLREPVRCVAQRRAKVVSERVGGGEAALTENADQPVGRGRLLEGSLRVFPDVAREFRERLAATLDRRSDRLDVDTIPCIHG